MAGGRSLKFAAHASLLFATIWHARADPGCSAETGDATSLLAMKAVPPRGHGKIDTRPVDGLARFGGGRGSFANVEALIRQLQSMSRAAGSSALPLPPDVEESFGIVRAHVESLDAHLRQEHDADQNAINGLIRLIEGCFDPPVADERDERRSDHARCRTQQAGLVDERAQCVSHDSTKAGMEGPPCALDDYPDGMSNESSGLKKNYTECLAKLGNWSESVLGLRRAWQACEEAGERLASKKEACDSKQTIFEDEFCKVSKVCDCHDRAVKEYEAQVAEFKIAEAARQADFRSGVRILCYFDALEEANESRKNDTYYNCSQKDVNATHLQLDYGTVPEPPFDCSLPSGRPCDASWEEEEYVKQPWHGAAPTERCEPCEGPASSVTTTTPMMTVESSIAPGYMALHWANCVGQVESDLGSCCEDNPEACRAFPVNGNWKQLIDLDERRKVLMIRGYDIYRLMDSDTGIAVPEALEHQSQQPKEHFTYNTRSREMYHVVMYGCKEHLTEEQIARKDAIENETGFPFNDGDGPSVLRQTADGNLSVAFGMCTLPLGCRPDPSDSRCSGRSAEIGQQYLDRLYEVNAGAEIDPNADISIHYVAPRPIVVDPDTDDLYIGDYSYNHWASRNVVWKYDAARQRARLFAGHLDSNELTGHPGNVIIGFGGPATAAYLPAVYAIALHPLTKELHLVGYPGHLARVDAEGNLQEVECSRCKNLEISSITYHKGEQQWIVMGSNLIFWQNGTIIVGTSTSSPKVRPSYDGDMGPWNATSRWIATWNGNMVLDEASNELYFANQAKGSEGVMVVNLSPA